MYRRSFSLPRKLSLLQANLPPVYSPEVQTIISRLSAGGYNLSDAQKNNLATKYNLFNTAGAIPLLFFDPSISVDTSTGTNTKVWNLGSSGVTGDGTLTNGNASNMVSTLSGANVFNFVSTSSQFIQLTAKFDSASWTWVSFARFNTVAATQDIIANQGGSRGSRWRLDGGQSKMRLYTADGANFSTSGFQGANNVAANTWKFVSGQKENTGLKLYIDLSGTVTLDNSVATTFQNYTSDNNITIGQNSGGSSYLQGRLGEIMIFNSALAQSQLQSIFNGSKAYYGL